MPTRPGGRALRPVHPRSGARVPPRSARPARRRPPAPQDLGARKPVQKRTVRCGTLCVSQSHTMQATAMHLEVNIKVQ